MKSKGKVSIILAIFLCITVLITVTPRVQAAGYFTENDVSNVECSILSNPVHAAYVNAMMRYHILSSDGNFRIGRNLENGASVVFFFDGCSDNVDHPVYGNFNNYHLSAYCAVVQKVGGVPKVVFESENCATVPDNPRNVTFNENQAVPTLLDGVYNIVSTNHKGRYAALNICDQSYSSAPVLRCDGTTSYISTSASINIHARRYFPGVPENGVSTETYNSTGCLNVGLIDNSWQEYNDFIYTVLGVSNAIITSPEEDGEWTQCQPHQDNGVVVVDRALYRAQLADIYGGDNSHTATALVSKITSYTDDLNKRWSAPFADVRFADWQYAAAEYACEKNLMAGKGIDAYGRIIFDPDNSITREEFAQVLYNAEDKPTVTIENPFPDVKNEWYKNAVLWANQAGIASGMGNGSFGVGLKITRQDLAMMLYKYAKLKGYSLIAEEGKIDQFADGSKVAGYAKSAMDWAVTYQILSGKGEAGKPLSTFKLDPAGTATRAECAAMLRNFMTAFNSTCSHSAMTKTEENAPTCSQQGYDLYQCADCGYTEKQNFTDPTGAHDYQLISDTATCTAAGIKTEACSACGDTKASPSTAKGHGATRTETKDATTSAAGYTRVICTVCNGVVSETTIPKLEDTHNCSDYMKRINCKDLQDGAVGINTDKFKRYTNVTILACSKCGTADTSSMKFVYSSSEASAIIVEMINQLRYEVYGTHAYDVQVATHHSAAEWAAEYITTDYSHCTPFVENLGQSNLNGNIIQKLFDSWKNSSGHYAAMINKDVKYISLAVNVSEATGAHSALVMWHKDELYLDNPNYTWDYR